jgi:hypothetical protein
LWVTCRHPHSDDAQREFEVIGAVPELPLGTEGHPIVNPMHQTVLEAALGLRLALDVERYRLGLADRIGDQTGVTAEGGEVALRY